MYTRCWTLTPKPLSSLPPKPCHSPFQINISISHPPGVSGAPESVPTSLLPQMPRILAPTCLSAELLGLALAEGADVAGLGWNRGGAQGPQARGTAVHGQRRQLRGDLLGLGDTPQRGSAPTHQLQPLVLPPPFSRPPVPEPHRACPARAGPPRRAHSPAASALWPPLPPLHLPLHPPPPAPGLIGFDCPHSSSPSPGSGLSASIEPTWKNEVLLPVYHSMCLSFRHHCVRGWLGVVSRKRDTHE